MKKRISIFLAAFLLLTMVGCGQSAGRTENQESKPALENTTSLDQVEQTTDISPEGLMAIYEALETEPDGRVAVKLSTGENGSNYLRPKLIGDLVQTLS